MAIPHAAPGQKIALTLGAALKDAVTQALFKTGELEVIRLVIPEGKKLPAHQVSGDITLHCLEGSVRVSALGTTQDLYPGQMLYLPGGEEHSLEGLEAASVLLTISLAPGPAQTGVGTER